MGYYGLLDNKKTNGNSEGFKIDESNKAIYENINIVGEDVVIDGNCILLLERHSLNLQLKLVKWWIFITMKKKLKVIIHG